MRSLERIVELLPFAVTMVQLRLSVCLSGMGVHWCTLAWMSVYGWIAQSSVQTDTKACPPNPSGLFPVPPGREVRYG